MTLLQSLFSGIILIATMSAEAQNGGRRPERPGRPPVYEPGRPGREIEKTAFINRQVRNETLPLKRLADIGREYRGYDIESVEVYMRPGRNSNATLALILDGIIEDERSIYNENFLSLRTRRPQTLGEDTQTLRLRVSGQIFIEKVVVVLSTRGNGGGGGNGPGYGREIRVPVQLPGYVPPSGRLDLTPFIQVNLYRGYTLVGVEITAAARYNAAFLDVVINSFSQGGISLDRYQTTQTVRVRQNFVIGQSLGNLQLEPRGDSAVYGVNLILVR